MVSRSQTVVRSSASATTKSVGHCSRGTDADGRIARTAVIPPLSRGAASLASGSRARRARFALAASSDGNTASSPSASISVPKSASRRAAPAPRRPGTNDLLKREPNALRHETPRGDSTTRSRVRDRSTNPQLETGGDPVGGALFRAGAIVSRQRWNLVPFVLG
jgi:hypothetical protein